MTTIWTRRSLLGAAAGGAVCRTFPAQASVRPGGALRIWGPTAMSDVVARLAEGFSAMDGGTRVEANLMGSDTAIPGLYAGLADIAFLGRENNVTDDNGFGRVKGYKPTRLEIMGGSVGTHDHTPALAVFVHRDAPVTTLTLIQIASVMACHEHGRPVTWRDLGIGGEFGDHTVRLYVENVESGTGIFFLKAVRHGDRKLSWDQVEDFSERQESTGHVPAATAVIAAVERDPYGIAITSLDAATAAVRPIAIAAATGAPVTLNRQSAIDHSYPLARRTYAFVDRRPGEPFAPIVERFLRYSLSNAGQGAISRCGTYLPLDSKTIAETSRILAS